MSRAQNILVVQLLEDIELPVFAASPTRTISWLPVESEPGRVTVAVVDDELSAARVVDDLPRTVDGVSLRPVMRARAVSAWSLYIPSAIRIRDDVSLLVRH